MFTSWSMNGNACHDELTLWELLLDQKLLMKEAIFDRSRHRNFSKKLWFVRIDLRLSFFECKLHVSFNLFFKEAWVFVLRLIPNILHNLVELIPYHHFRSSNQFFPLIVNFFLFGIKRLIHFVFNILIVFSKNRNFLTFANSVLWKNFVYFRFYF